MVNPQDDGYKNVYQNSVKHFKKFFLKYDIKNMRQSVRRETFYLIFSMSKMFYNVLHFCQYNIYYKNVFQNNKQKEKERLSNDKHSP